MTAVQLSLPLEAAPPKVRAHGLRDAHERPLVSRGKRRDGSFPGSFRVSPQDAWHYPSLELRAGNSWPVLILDCDGGEGTARLVESYMIGNAPTPNWIVTRVSSGGSHAVYTLARPVHRGEAAREAPLRLFARVSERLAELTGADSGYRAVLTHNPMARAQGNDLRTIWLEREPLDLRDTAARIVPLGWRMPSIKRTDIGRNWDLFKPLMRWAGSPANLGYPVLPVALKLAPEIRQQYPNADHLFPDNEVAGVAKSVERYRVRWIAEGRFYGPGNSSYDHSPEAQSWRGTRSGEAKRERTADRDAAICADYATGAYTQRDLAAKYGLSQNAIKHILHRDGGRQLELGL